MRDRWQRSRRTTLCSSSLERWAADIVRDQGFGGYFERVGRADSRLTALLVTPQSSLGATIRDGSTSGPAVTRLRSVGPSCGSLLDSEIDAGLGRLVTEYVAVRTGGYMIRNWRSTVEHVWELAFLASDPVKSALTQLHDSLPHT